MSSGGSRRTVYPVVEQDTIPFYGRQLVAVVLEDGRICAILRWLCEGLPLFPCVGVNSACAHPEAYDSPAMYDS